MNRVIFYAISCAFLVYQILGSVGYISFPGQLSSNVIAMCSISIIIKYVMFVDPASVTITIGQFAIAMLALQRPELHKALEQFRQRQSDAARQMTLPPAA
jgi:hypothetical protein